MFSLKLKELILCVFMSLFTISCDDSSPISSEEHTDTDGFILEDESGNEIYREFEGETTGSITISIGDTLELSVHFLDHNGNEIGHEEGEEGHDDKLAISGNNSNIAIIENEEHEEGEEGEEGEEDHEMALHIIGVSEGETSFKLELMHGDHADYTSTNNVSVTVNGLIMISCSGQLCFNNCCINTFYALK